MDPVSNVRDLAHVAELLKAHDRYIVVPHTSPDPDAIGAACGLALALRQVGKVARVATDERAPVNTAFLTRLCPMDSVLPDDLANWKLIFVDGGERHRMPKLTRDLPIFMNLDHHLDNGGFADWIYVDTQAAATSLIVTRLLEPLGVTPTAAMATCLYAGLLFDTRGGFITDRCTPELYRAVATLVEAGAQPDVINRELHEQMSFGDFKLYGAALNGLKAMHSGKLVYAVLTRQMAEETGGGELAMEMLTQHLPRIAGGEVYALLKETADGAVKVSLRSKGRVAVNAIAKPFGGGGHRFAAGIRFEGLSVETAVRTLAGAVESALATSA